MYRLILYVFDLAATICTVVTCCCVTQPFIPTVAASYWVVKLQQVLFLSQLWRILSTDTCNAFRVWTPVLVSPQLFEWRSTSYLHMKLAITPPPPIICFQEMLIRGLGGIPPTADDVSRSPQCLFLWYSLNTTLRILTIKQPCCMLIWFLAVYLVYLHDFWRSQTQDSVIVKTGV